MWDVLGSIHNFFNKAPANQGPFNADGKVNFGTSLDIAKSLPKNPTSFNDHIETARVAGINAAEFALKPVAFGISALDSKSNGVFGKALMAGTGNVRSNYAFTRDLASHNAGMGLLSGIGMIAGGVLGGIAGFAGGLALGGVGAIPGAVVGFDIGAGLAGKAERSLAKSGTFGAYAEQSAKLSESAVGQEKYNFGRDVIHTAAASHIAGWKSWGDTSKGFGALVSGFLNFGFEVSLAPDIKAVKGVGIGVKGLTGSSGIQAKLSGPIEKSLAKVDLPKYGTEIERQYARKAADTELHVKTGAGEKTAYTPLYEYIKNNDAVAIQSHPFFKGNEYGQIAAPLLAGQDFKTQSLLFRIGRDDLSAVTELSKTAPAVFAALARYEGKFKTVIGEDGAQQTSIVLGKIKDNKTMSEIQKAEITDLVSKNAWLGRVMLLDNALPNKIAGKFDFIEKTKIDRAKQRVANSLELGKLDITTRETLRGKVMQTVYQSSSLGIPIRFFARGVDDAPHQTINFNDVLQSNTRVRTTARMAVRKLDMPPEEARQFVNDFAMATNEGAKDILIDKFNDKIFTYASKKYKVADDGKLKDKVLNKYVETTKLNREKARVAKAKNEAYFVEGDNTLEATVLHDPQLISQLANGAYIADVELIDNAFKAYTAKGIKDKFYSSATRAAVVNVADEFLSIWRSLTLLRVGFPVNIMRDSTLRAWGDGVLWDMTKYLSKDLVDSLANSSNTVARIRKELESRVDPSKNLKKINLEIQDRRYMIEAAERTLKASKYDVVEKVGVNVNKAAKDFPYKLGDSYTSSKSKITGTIQEIKSIKGGVRLKLDIDGKPRYTVMQGEFNVPKKPKVLSSEVQRHIELIKTAKEELAHFEKAKNALDLNVIPDKVVGSQVIKTAAGDFEGAFVGVQGKIFLDKIRGKDTLRGLMASNRELGVANVRRDRNGGVPVEATKNEEAHMLAWEHNLVNVLPSDPVARMIMGQKMSEAKIIKWIASPESGNYIERFGYNKLLKKRLDVGDAPYIYDRVLNVVNTLAPDVALQKLVMQKGVTRSVLRKMYPDLEKRPRIISDFVLDSLGQSEIVKSINGFLADKVAWLATAPTSRLSYNPYFAIKYEEKLQNMVAIANREGKKFSEIDKRSYESMARAHALTEYHNKINAFNRDMNYNEIINYTMAFFPAVVEQFRAYGNIMLDHPEFPYKIQQMSMIPSQYGNVQKDANGNEYVEVTLPLLGGLKGRLPVNWFNAINPTGGHIISGGPVTAFATNKISQRINLPQWFMNFALPFGTTANDFAPITPNTARKLGEAFQAYFTKGGEQFNKDANMFLEKRVFDFREEYHKDPGSELAGMYTLAAKDATQLSVLKFLGSGILPAQPQYYTALQVYSDLLRKYQDQYGEEGDNRFIEDYPDYFLLADKLSDSTSGIRPDDTAVALVRKNPKVIESIIAKIGGKGNLSALGAIFNDADYAFSASANAYLVSHAIPGTRQSFKEQGAALENSRSSIVNSGWREYSHMIEVVTQELVRTNTDPGSGYGASILDAYRKAFIEKSKTDNPLWYSEKQGTGFQKKQVDTIDALTIALNTPALWKDLSKQDRWYTIAEYLNFRYDMNSALKARGSTITADNATDLKFAADAKVAALRAKDVNFGRFYDRYFSNDDFSYVADTQNTGVK